MYYQSTNALYMYVLIPVALLL